MLINSHRPLRTEFEVKNQFFIVVLRVKFGMGSKRASVNPPAGFLKPQFPADRLAAQHRDRENLQSERQLKELQKEEAKARGRSCTGRGSSRSCKRKRQRQGFPCF